MCDRVCVFLCFAALYVFFFFFLNFLKGKGSVENNFCSNGGKIGCLLGGLICFSLGVSFECLRVEGFGKGSNSKTHKSSRA